MLLWSGEPRSSPRRRPPVRHVEEALVVLAAGGLSPGALPDALRAVRELHETMHVRRVGRLRQLGFEPQVAEEISQLHTPNFM